MQKENTFNVHNVAKNIIEKIKEKNKMRKETEVNVYRKIPVKIRAIKARKL